MGNSQQTSQPNVTENIQYGQETLKQTPDDSNLYQFVSSVRISPRETLRDKRSKDITFQAPNMQYQTQFPLNPAVFPSKKYSIPTSPGWSPQKTTSGGGAGFGNMAKLQKQFLENKQSRDLESGSEQLELNGQKTGFVKSHQSKENELKKQTLKKTLNDQYLQSYSNRVPPNSQENDEGKFFLQLNGELIRTRILTDKQIKQTEYDIQSDTISLVDVKSYILDRDKEKENPKRFVCNVQKSPNRTHFVPSTERPSVFNPNPKYENALVKDQFVYANEYVSSNASSVPRSPSFISVSHIIQEQEPKISDIVEQSIMSGLPPGVFLMPRQVHNGMVIKQQRTPRPLNLRNQIGKFNISDSYSKQNFLDKKSNSSNEINEINISAEKDQKYFKISTTVIDSTGSFILKNDQQANGEFFQQNNQQFAQMPQSLIPLQDQNKKFSAELIKSLGSTTSPGQDSMIQEDGDNMPLINRKSTHRIIPTPSKHTQKKLHPPHFQLTIVHSASNETNEEKQKLKFGTGILKKMNQTNTGIMTRNNNTISEEISTPGVVSNFNKKSQNYQNADLNMSIISSELQAAESILGQTLQTTQYLRNNDQLKQNLEELQLSFNIATIQQFYDTVQNNFDESPLVSKSNEQPRDTSLLKVRNYVESQQLTERQKQEYYAFFLSENQKQQFTNIEDKVKLNDFLIQQLEIVKKQNSPTKNLPPFVLGQSNSLSIANFAFPSQQKKKSKLGSNNISPRASLDVKLQKNVSNSKNLQFSGSNPDFADTIVLGQQIKILDEKKSPTQGTFITDEPEIAQNLAANEQQHKILKTEDISKKEKTMKDDPTQSNQNQSNFHDSSSFSYQNQSKKVLDQVFALKPTFTLTNELVSQQDSPFNRKRNIQQMTGSPVPHSNSMIELQTQSFVDTKKLNIETQIFTPILDSQHQSSLVLNSEQQQSFILQTGLGSEADLGRQEGTVNNSITFNQDSLQKQKSKKKTTEQSMVMQKIFTKNYEGRQTILIGSKSIKKQDEIQENINTQVNDYQDALIQTLASNDGVVSRCISDDPNSYVESQTKINYDDGSQESKTLIANSHAQSPFDQSQKTSPYQTSPSATRIEMSQQYTVPFTYFGTQNQMFNNQDNILMQEEDEYNFKFINTNPSGNLPPPSSLYTEDMEQALLTKILEKMLTKHQIYKPEQQSKEAKDYKKYIAYKFETIEDKLKSLDIQSDLQKLKVSFKKYDQISGIQNQFSQLMKQGIEKSVMVQHTTQGIKDNERKQQIREANVAIKLQQLRTTQGSLNQAIFEPHGHRTERNLNNQIKANFNELKLASDQHIASNHHLVTLNQLSEEKDNSFEEQRFIEKFGMRNQGGGQKYFVSNRSSARQFNDDEYLEYQFDENKRTERSQIVLPPLLGHADSSKVSGIIDQTGFQNEFKKSSRQQRRFSTFQAKNSLVSVSNQQSDKEGYNSFHDWYNQYNRLEDILRFKMPVVKKSLLTNGLREQNQRLNKMYENLQNPESNLTQVKRHQILKNKFGILGKKESVDHGSSRFQLEIVKEKFNRKQSQHHNRISDVVLGLTKNKNRGLKSGSWSVAIPNDEVKQEKNGEDQQPFNNQDQQNYMSPFQSSRINLPIDDSQKVKFNLTQELLSQFSQNNEPGNQNEMNHTLNSFTKSQTVTQLNITSSEISIDPNQATYKIHPLTYKLAYLMDEHTNEIRNKPKMNEYLQRKKQDQELSQIKRVKNWQQKQVMLPILGKNKTIMIASSAKLCLDEMKHVKKGKKKVEKVQELPENKDDEELMKHLNIVADIMANENN